MSNRLRIALLIVLVLGGAALARFTSLGPELERLAAAIASEARAPWAAPAFIGLYAAALAVGIPGTLLTVIGGVAFGVERGLAINLSGALLGATAAFFEGRYLARDAVWRLFGHHLARLPDLAPWRTSFFAFLRLRLIPLVPFNALNFAAGLTRTRLLPYVAGTAIGILPSTLAYTCFASALTRGGDDRDSAVAWLLFILGAAFLAGVVPSLIKLAHERRRLHRQPGGDVVPGAPGPHLRGPRDARRHGAIPPG